MLRACNYLFTGQDRNIAPGILQLEAEKSDDGVVSKFEVIDCASLCDRGRLHYSK